MRRHARSCKNGKCKCRLFLLKFKEWAAQFPLKADTCLPATENTWLWYALEDGVVTLIDTLRSF